MLGIVLGLGGILILIWLVSFMLKARARGGKKPLGD